MFNPKHRRITITDISGSKRRQEQKRYYSEGFSLPNGLCSDRNGDFIIANFGTNRLEHLARNGDWKLILDQMDGRPLGKTNFPALDSKGRLWFTVTASIDGWATGRSLGEADGYIAVIDQNGPRIVADKIAGANEIRFAEDETRLTVAETGGDHIQHFRVQPDGSLTDREIYGPKRLGGGPDGFCFDAYSNIWTTLIAADRLVAITPEGDVLTIWEDGDRAAKAEAIAAFGKEGRRLSLGPAPGDGLAPRMASVTIGGTVYVHGLWGRWWARRCRRFGSRCRGRWCRGGRGTVRTISPARPASTIIHI